MKPRISPVGGSGERSPTPFLVAVAVPLAVAAAAYALWWTSDRLLSVGPLDPATFGWALVAPMWAAAPVAAGFAWSRLTRRRSLHAALVVGTVTTGVGAVLLWQAVADPSCEFGAIRTPVDWVVPALVLGGVIGGGLAASGLLAAKLVRDGNAWRAVVLGAGAGVVTVVVAILVAGATLLGPACQRPPV